MKGQKSTFELEDIPQVTPTEAITFDWENRCKRIIGDFWVSPRVLLSLYLK